MLDRGVFAFVEIFKNSRGSRIMEYHLVSWAANIYVGLFTPVLSNEGNFVLLQKKKSLVLNFGDAVLLRENSSFNSGDNQVLSILDLLVFYSLDQRSKNWQPAC